MAKFRLATPFGCKDLESHTLHFDPIFDPFEKNCKGDLHPQWNVCWQDLVIL